MTPTLPFLGGIANHTFYFIPYYMWVIVFMMIMGLILGALFYFFFWVKLTPYHGLLWATTGLHIEWKYGIIPIPQFKGKTGLSFVFDENMNMDLITDRSSKVIFAETFKEAQDAENDNSKTPTATIGSVHADFIFDPDKWTYPNSYQHKIIEDIAERWNNVNPDDQVRTLVKFARYVEEGRFNEHYADELSHLKLMYVVPWARIRMMYKDKEESDYFGVVMSIANAIRDIEQASFNQYAIMVLGMFAMLDIMYFIAWFIMRKPV
jgi:hypothetical protein